MTEKQPAQPVKDNPQTEAPPAKLPKKQKPWLVISLVVLLVVSLGVAGYFAYQNYSLKNKKGSDEELVTPPPVLTQPPSPIPTETPLPTPTPDPFLGWLTYLKNCYTFKYPSNITLTERPEEDLVHLSLWGSTQKPDTGFYDGISLSFSYPLNLGNLSLMHFLVWFQKIIR